jgi:hypothetical protein
MPGERGFTIHYFKPPRVRKVPEAADWEMRRKTASRGSLNVPGIEHARS